MAKVYTVPPVAASLATPNVVTAAEWNLYVGDNFDVGIPGIFTTKGDLLAGIAANSGARLPVGISGQVLKALSSETTGLVYAALNTGVAAQYKIASEQDINNTTVTPINYATEVFDTDSAVTVGAGWKFEPPADGYYLVAASLLLKADTDWGVGEYIVLSAAWGASSRNLAIQYMQVAASSGYRVYLCGSTVLSLVTTDDLYIAAYQNSGGTIVTSDDGDYSRVSIVKLV